MSDILGSSDWEMLLRLIIAAVLGLMIGLERELKRKSLGLKTILVISIISCLLTIVSIQSAYLLPDDLKDVIRTDPFRLSAQIVTGVGFLGAGVILRRGDDTISGLTTAAIVWGAAGIGITVGAGFYVEAVVGVALLLVSVELVPPIIFKYGFKQLRLKELHVQITVKSREDIQPMLRLFENEVKEIELIRIKDMDETTYLVELYAMVYYDVNPSSVYEKLTQIEQVQQIELHA